MLAPTLALVLAASTSTSLDLAELSRRGAETTKKISVGGARWFVRQKLGQPRDLGLRVTRFGDAAQYDFLLLDGDKESPIYSISERAGVWATTLAPGRPPVITRPYEVFLPAMTVYLLLAKSDLQVVKPTGTELLARSSATTSTWVSSRAPGVDEALQSMLLNMKGRSAQLDGGVDQTVAKLEKMLSEVPMVEVDNATGLVLHAGPADRGLFFSQLEVLTKRPAILEPALPEAPAVEALDSMSFAIAWDPMWKPGGAEHDTDMVLTHLEQDWQRRVPNKFGLTAQLTFLSPRSQVVVITSMPTGGFRPLWIDLVTGENKLLGDAWGAVPVVLFPVASPDAKRVAVLAQREGLTSQLQVIDVATGAVRNVGAPADQVFVNWLADDGFLLVRRVRKEGQKDSLSRIVRLSRDGKETELVSNATRPVVLNEKELLFRDLSTDKWTISDLAGKRRRVLGDGLSSLFAPTVSPDGELLLMMESTPAPEPRLVSPRTGEVRNVPLGRGLWANPQWR
jgi:hypothetical protein